MYIHAVRLKVNRNRVVRLLYGADRREGEARLTDDTGGKWPSPTCVRALGEPVRVTWKRAVQAVIDTPMAVSNKGLRRPTESVGPHLHAT